MLPLKVFENICLTGSAVPVLLHYISQEKSKDLEECFLSIFEAIWKALFYFDATID